MWTRLERAVAAQGSVTWFSDRVLRHPAIGRGRTGAARTWTHVLDVCYPLIVLGRGTRRGLALTVSRWRSAPKDKRRLQAAVAVLCAVAVAVLHYGPVLLGAAFLGTVAWLGRDTSRKGADPETPAHISRLQSVYNGLVPYLADEDDPDRHFKPGGRYRDAFTAWEFDDEERLVRLRFDYSEYFRDGEADSRRKVERALEGKIGQSGEYLYGWDEAGNHLDVRVLPPLAAGIAAQPWPVAEIEFVLGVTDPGSASRLIPVTVPAIAGAPASASPTGSRTVHLAPVVWRLGEPNPNPHLLVAGAPCSGKSTVVRSLIGQALSRGHRVAVMDTGQTAEYATLIGRPGVLRVAETPADGAQLFAWAGPEIERQAALGRAHRDEGAAAADGGAEPPLWLFIDDLPELCDAARRLGLPDPLDTVVTLARTARQTRTTLVVTAGADRIGALPAALRNQLTTRIALGRVDPAASTLLFGATLDLGGTAILPPGRGYVRLGQGPVIRLQTPYAPTLAMSGA